MSLQFKLHENEIEVGIDEVGRGCLAGPVFAAAVILPDKFPDDIYLGIKDSKKLSNKKRILLSEYIKKNAIAWSIAQVDSTVIDEINILQSSFKAMHLALDKLSVTPEHILVDGNLFKPYYSLQSDDFITHSCVINGDNHYYSIAAASILAKVTRDEWMIQLHNNNMNLQIYQWDKNKGYATKTHREALLQYGLCKYHRKTFGLCKRLLNQSK